jgi:diketogulonate reductase-like aldo/keto reductase
MLTRKLAGQDVPVIGQGTYLMEHDDRSRAIASLRRGLDLGMTHIDTAEMYGAGRVEELVAEATVGKRDQVFLASKVLPSNASREGTIRACEASLERLKTDYLDLYLLHWTSSHPFGETLAGFEKLQKDGKIRAYGVSNFDVDDLEEAWPLAGNAIACNQVAYHLKERYIERRVLPWCKEHGIPIVAYSPFGQGRFPRQGRGRAVLDQIARQRGMTPWQMALAFLTCDPQVLAIPKSSKIKHIEENAAAGDLVLAPEEMAAISEAFPLGPDRGMPFL